MTRILLIFLGGGLGSVCRYLIGLMTTGINGSLKFPVGTLICNIVGCFLIGLLNNLAAKMGWNEELRLMLTVGLCGGFTTFSTFSNEGLAMLQNGQIGIFAIYALGSFVLGILAVLLGSSL